MNKLPYVNQLAISPYCKTIPYASDRARRANGRMNHGFKNLKTKPELIETVPELLADDAMMALVKALNDPKGSFFTAGCFSHYRLLKATHPADDVLGCYEGYVEFAFDCCLRVQDAKNYFSLFFHFSPFLEDICFRERVRFDWLLERIYFTDPDVKGFSAAVFVQTLAAAEFAQAQTAWRRSLHALGGFLDSVQPQRGVAMYGLPNAHLRKVAA